MKFSGPKPFYDLEIGINWLAVLLENDPSKSIARLKGIVGKNEKNPMHGCWWPSRHQLCDVLATGTGEDGCSWNGS